MNTPSLRELCFGVIFEHFDWQNSDEIKMALFLTCCCKFCQNIFSKNFSVTN